MPQPPAKLWIGPSGWSYPDWNGLFYPPEKPRGFRPLAYLARYFNAVEVNATFYRLPTPRMTAGWPSQVPRDFRFAIKLTQTFTHTRDDFPADDVPVFQDALEPLRGAGLLGPLLIQFPWSFRYESTSVEWLHWLAESFAEYDRFIEVRHASWAAPPALAALRRFGGYCNIDQPVLHDCLGPTTHVFGPTAYVRLHGRNYRNWFADDQPPFERYNYLYSEAELREWVQRLNELRDTAEELFIFTNNHYRAQAPVNALELRALLGDAPLDVPPPLLRAYPRLHTLARPAPPDTLFDL
jgi:uncharacterized protein YecE (DUF72 family)